MPATSEAARIAAFAMAMVLASTNARFVTKMAMVKPTPPSTDTPAIWPQLTPAGRSLKRSLTVSHVAKKIPSGLPNNRPQNTPMVTGLVTTASGSKPVSTTLAFENANSGRMKKYTGMCRR